MKIYIAADHGGFLMKQSVHEWLIQEGHQVEDCGNTILDPNDDYPDFAFAAAQKVADSLGEAVGILFCRSGGGMVIVANKIKGIRAVDVFDMTSAIHARTNNNANVISIGADWMDIREAKLIIKNFLETDFHAEERHLRRLEKIAQREQ